MKAAGFYTSGGIVLPGTSRVVGRALATIDRGVLPADIDLRSDQPQLATITMTTDRLRSTIKLYTRTVVAGTLGGSAILNARAFAVGADGTAMMMAGATLGGSIPGLIFCLTMIAAGLWIDAHDRQQH